MCGVGAVLPFGRSRRPPEAFEGAPEAIVCQLIRTRVGQLISKTTLWPIRPPLSLEREQRLSKAPGQRQYVILHRALKVRVSGNLPTQ